jgi:hypothetical protein
MWIMTSICNAHGYDEVHVELYITTSIHIRSLTIYIYIYIYII